VYDFRVKNRLRLIYVQVWILTVGITAAPEEYQLDIRRLSSAEAAPAITSRSTPSLLKPRCGSCWCQESYD
jgi:hypothetical protein